MICTGQAIIDGKSTCISSDLQEALKHVGYCPQHDGSLCDLLTVWENYELFCAAKGVVPKSMEKRDLPIIRVRADNEYVYFPTNGQSMRPPYLVQGQPNATLLHASPSERRQLSIAIALIGDPRVSR